MDRRAFVGGIAGGVLAVPLRARGQPAGKIWRVAFLYFGSRESAMASGRYNAFVEAMRALGYVEGHNLDIEARFGDAAPERLPGLVAELTRSNVDVFVATGSPVYRALLQAGLSIPVVVTVTADPVLEGIAASLARPGGNFTGLSDAAAVLGPKHLELLMSAVPHLTRAGVLLNPDNSSHPAQLQRLTAAAQRVKVRIVTADAARTAEIDPGFTSLAAQHAGGVLLFGDTFFAAQIETISQAAARNRLPSIYLLREYARAGGLMSYGPDLVENFRRSASYVDKVLKGAKPRDLPFEQPARYVLSVNLKTARELGLTIPQSLLVRADELIE